jgi:hypothetical protein
MYVSNDFQLKYYIVGISVARDYYYYYYFELFLKIIISTSQNISCTRGHVTQRKRYLHEP